MGNFRQLHRNGKPITINRPWADVADVLHFTRDAWWRWKPEVGGTIRGKIAQRALGTDRFGLHRVCVMVDRRGDERHVWLSHADLKDQFRRWAPRVGDHIVVERLDDLGLRKRYHLTIVRSG